MTDDKCMKLNFVYYVYQYAQFSTMTSLDNEDNHYANKAKWLKGQTSEIKKILQQLNRENAQVDYQFFLDEVEAAKRRAWNYINAKRKKQRTPGSYEKALQENLSLAVNTFLSQIFPEDYFNQEKKQ